MNEEYLGVYRILSVPPVLDEPWQNEFCEALEVNHKVLVYKDESLACDICMRPHGWPTNAEWLGMPQVIFESDVLKHMVKMGSCSSAAPEEREYPHTCPYCGSPAYIGFLHSNIDCTKGCK